MVMPLAAVLSPAWRLVLAVLVVVSRVTTPLLVAATVVANDPPIPPAALIHAFLLVSALPAAVAWLVERAFAGTAEVTGDTLRLRRGDLEIELPATAIAAVRPWWLPLPDPGLTLSLRSGRRLGFGLAVTDPVPLLVSLGRMGVATGAAARHPTVRYAGARPRRRARSTAIKFLAFGLIPAGVLFNAHQHIAYGGSLGQYHLQGPGPYLRTFAEYWTVTVVHLLGYAAAWRGAAEGAAWLTAAVAPSQVARVRRAVEALCVVAYYAGVPALLAARFLA